VFDKNYWSNIREIDGHIFLYVSLKPKARILPNNRLLVLQIQAYIIKHKKLISYKNMIMCIWYDYIFETSMKWSKIVKRNSRI
jgi:hypothetical protein